MAVYTHSWTCIVLCTYAWVNIHVYLCVCICIYVWMCMSVEFFPFFFSFLKMFYFLFNRVNIVERDTWPCGPLMRGGKVRCEDFLLFLSIASTTWLDLRKQMLYFESIGFHRYVTEDFHSPIKPKQKRETKSSLLLSQLYFTTVNHVCTKHSQQNDLFRNREKWLVLSFKRIPVSG